MNKIMCLFAVCFLVLTGCMSTHHAALYSMHKGEVVRHIVNRETIPVYIDNRFTVVERGALMKAISAWEEVFNGQIVFSLASGFEDKEEGIVKYRKVKRQGEGIVFFRLDSEDPAVSEVSESALAFAPLGGHYMVIVWDRIGTRNLKTIVMHEMGHLFGTGHMHGSSLMHAYYGFSQYDCIDKILASEVAAFKGLKLENMSYCVVPGFE